MGDTDVNHFRQWMHRLGGPTQRRNVPYVNGTKRWCTCLLCGTGEMRGAVTIRSHFEGSSHAANYERVKALETAERLAAEAEKRRNYSAVLTASLGQIRLTRWRNEIKAFLYDYIQTGNAGHLTRASRLYLMEKFSLLELALWKANICDGIVFSSMQEMREYEVLDSAFDPNAYATEKRMTSGCEVIIPLVLSFMKKE